jgi:acyl-CoA thioester hydrolase
MDSRETRLCVRYAETDQMGVAYYSNYFVWMEVGRTEYCKAIGFRYRDMEEQDGVLLAVVGASCRYLSPARYDDEIIVRTWVQQANSRMIRFGYEMREAESGRKLVEGETKHLFCGKDMKPARLPEKYYSLFGITR